MCDLAVNKALRCRAIVLVSDKSLGLTRPAFAQAQALIPKIQPLTWLMTLIEHLITIKVVKPRCGEEA